MSPVQQLVDMGFMEEDAKRALHQVSGNVEQAVERLLAEVGADPTPPPSPRTPKTPPGQLSPVFGGSVREDLGVLAPNPPNLNLAPPTSLQQQIAEALDAEEDGLCSTPESSRKPGYPCGLMNIGNTCYVNSLLQTFLHLDEFRDWMLRYRTPDETKDSPSDGICPESPGFAQGERPDESAAQQSRRTEHGISLACELRRLFALSLFTTRNCIDPSKLLAQLVDRKGNNVPIGSQEDVGEFMLKFLDQLEEGLRSGNFASTAAQGKDPSISPVPSRTGVPDVDDHLRPGAPTGNFHLDAVQEGQDLDAEVAEKKHQTEQESGKKQLGLLHLLFFGEQVQMLSYKEESSEADPKGIIEEQPGTACSPMVVSEEPWAFLHIFLDVKNQNLYKAWEAARHAEIDYTTPAGVSTRARTNTWIKRLPKLLFFQLQRVAFNQETMAQVKVDDAFEFEKTIYVDRFLLHRKEESIEAALHAGKLQRERDKLREDLCCFENFHGRQGLLVSDSLSWAADCLERNASDARETPPQADKHNASSPVDSLVASLLSRNSPGCKELSSGLERSAATSVELLRSVSDALRSEVVRLRERIEELSLRIHEAYAGLRRHAYELSAIWVHSGIAGSGHYFAYILDWKRDCWYRIDDAAVSEVPWETVREAAVGQEGNKTSAYVLVYADPMLVSQQRQQRDIDEILKNATDLVPPQLLKDVHKDNELFQKNQLLRQQRHAEQELRRHAEAIFQHYAGLIHQWEPQKRTGDTVGNPHDAEARKYLHDSALLSFELFLYRLHAEQDVWTYFIMQSIEAQRKVRAWKLEEEGRVLYFLANTLRNQKCYAGMLKAVADSPLQCELIPQDMAKMSAHYNVVLTQAFIVDESLQGLQEDGSTLMKTIGILAFVWSRWNLEADDKFRQNEVLLIMSTLISNTVNVLERSKKTMPDVSLAALQTSCEYFFLLLHAVEWPKNWKAPLIQRIQGLFPQVSLSVLSAGSRSVAEVNSGPLGVQPGELRETVFRHPFTQAQASVESYDVTRMEPGKDFFTRHRSLYSWVMNGDEVIAYEFVVSQAPGLKVEPVERGRDC